MALGIADIDRAILARLEQQGRFTVAQLRADLNAAPQTPESKNISNRVHRLYKKMHVLRNDGINERNIAYVSRDDKKLAAFKRSVGVSTQPIANEPPIKKLARLAEFEDVRAAVLDMAGKVDETHRLVRELHAGLFGQTEAAPRKQSA